MKVVKYILSVGQATKDNSFILDKKYNFWNFLRL